MDTETWTPEQIDRHYQVHMPVLNADLDAEQTGAVENAFLYITPSAARPSR